MFEKSHLYLYKIFNLIPKSGIIPMEIVKIIFDINLDLSFDDIIKYYIKQYSVEAFISKFLFEFDKDEKFKKKFRNKIYNIEFLNTHKKISRPLHIHVHSLDHFKHYIKKFSAKFDQSAEYKHKIIYKIIKYFNRKKYKYGLIDLEEFRYYFYRYFPHHYSLISYDSIYRNKYGNHIQNYNEAIENMKNEVYSRLVLISKCYMKFKLNN